MQPDALAAGQPPVPSTVADATELAVEGLIALGELGEEIDDEWQYVQDLVAAWRERLDAVAATRGPDAISPEQGAAVARAVDEASRIGDPHRAIDWLSTLPQVVLVALGERP